MSMSDCEKCWSTPCICGWDYRDWSAESLESQIKMLEGVLAKKQKTLVGGVQESRCVEVKE